LDIITVEGPMPCHRAYRLYALAVGIQRVGRSLRSSFNRAVRRAIHLGLIEEREEHMSRDQMNEILRKAGTPAVLLRAVGTEPWRRSRRPRTVAAVYYASLLMPLSPSRLGSWRLRQRPHGRGLVDGPATAHTADPVLRPWMGGRQNAPHTP
jgi:hypothetical protein